jgi:ribonuclease T2
MFAECVTTNPNTRQALEAAGITPDNDATYKLSDIQDAAAAIHSGITPYFDCDDDTLSAVYYYFYISGNAINGNYTATESRMCSLDDHV